MTKNLLVMIKFFQKIQLKRRYLILLQKMLLKVFYLGIMVQFLPMDKLALGRHIQWLENLKILLLEA